MFKMIECTKEEFDNFVKDYPKKLRSDFYPKVDSITLDYKDSTLGGWPCSVVASCKVLSNGKQGGWRIATTQPSIGN